MGSTSPASSPLQPDQPSSAPEAPSGALKPPKVPGASGKKADWDRKTEKVFKRIGEEWGLEDPGALILIYSCTSTNESDGSYNRYYKILDRSTSQPVAIIAAAFKWSGNTLVNVEGYTIRDQASLIKALKAVAAEVGGLVSSHIRSFGVKDPVARYEIAKITAGSHSGATARDFDHFDIEDQSARIEIAKIAVAHPPCSWITSAHVSCYFANFGIKDSAARLQMAKIAASQDPRKLAFWIERFGIEDEIGRAEVAKIALASASSVGDVAFHMDNFRITDQTALVELARIGAEQGSLSPWIRTFGITDQKSLVQLAKLDRERRGGLYWPDGYFNNEDWRIEDTKLLVELARSVAERFKLHPPKDPLDALLWKFLHCGLDGPTLRANVFCDFLDEIPFSGSAGDMYRHVVTFVTSSCSPDDGEGRYQYWSRIVGEPAGECQTQKRVEQIAEWLKERLPFLNEEIFSYHNEVQSEGAVIEAFAATLACWNSANNARFSNRARASLAKLTGYDSIPAGHLSPNTSRELWGVLMEAHRVFGDELSRVVPVDLRDLPRALRIVTLATAIKGLDREVPIFRETISSEKQFEEAERDLVKVMTSAFVQALDLPELDSPEAVRKLWEKWGGNLTPFVVLAGRYSRNSDWRAEMKVLREIASNCLSESFHSWRYRRGDGQLSMFTDSQLERWHENPIKIAEHVAGQGSERTALNPVITGAREIFTSNILAHLPEKITQHVRANHLTVDQLKSYLMLSERMFSALPLTEAMVALRHAVESEDREMIRVAAKLVNGSKNRLLKGLGDADIKQLSSDFASINDLSRNITSSSGTRYTVISVITDHPKLLLMTGDLVQCSSCQNYRTGSYVHTLPGYVVDGNIKLALSYVIKSARLEFLQRDSAPSQMRFDPATQSLLIDGVQEPIPLGYAVRRQVLRVGRVESEPVCVIERPYLQNHAIADSIEAQQSALITGYLESCGVRPRHPTDAVECPASRNPMGVYSDAGRGVERGAYTIPPSATGQANDLDVGGR